MQGRRRLALAQAALVAFGLSSGWALGAETATVDSLPGPGLVGFGVDPVVDDGLPRGEENLVPRDVPLATPTTLFRWPLLKQDWWRLSNYVDLDDTSPNVLDWNCQNVTYDGHHGNDIIIRDFVEQDQGRYAIAAAPGTVLDVVDGFGDRDVACESFNANYVRVLHADGTESWYLHLRKWSTMVYAGQQVLEGQPVGLIGSSGCSTDPHLHFEIQNAAQWYEAGAGACRAGTSLWKTPPAHSSFNAADLYSSGFTTTAPDGNSIKSRPPDLTHVRQSGVVPTYLWLRLSDIHNGDVSEVIYKKPGGAVYADWINNHTAYYSSSWWYYQTNLPSSGSTGTWTVEYKLNGVLKATRTFTYDAVAYASPTATGRTVTVAHGTARDRLVGADADGPLATFQLAGSPANGEVRLSGPRNTYFNYVPESGFTGNDTFTVQSVDGLGTVSAAATMTMSVTPTLANALRLENEGDYVSVPSNAVFNLTSAFTIEAWIRRTPGSNGWQSIFDRRHPTLFNNYGFHFFLMPDSRLRLAAGTGSTAFYAFGTTQIPLNRWTHVAGTWDGAMLRIFVDGVEEPGAVAFAGPISYTGVGEMRLGGSLASPAEGFRGEIEEMRVWNVARTASDLKQGATCAFFDAGLPASVKASWRFQGNANDSSVNARHGTRMGGASFVRADSAFALNCAVQDLDGDTRADGSDNCPLDSNVSQTDTDLDGIGNPCDLCPALSARTQFDSDADGVGDACDNCPFLGNTDQLDSDSDGSGDLCDPLPASNAEAVPTDAITLSLSHNKTSGVTTVTWTGESHSATYEIFRGARTDLPIAFYGVCQNSRDTSTADTTFLEDQAPAAGQAYYFLVIGVSPSGVPGLAGLDSSGRQRDVRAKDCL